MKEITVRVYDMKTKVVTLNRMVVNEGRINGHIAWDLFFYKSDGTVIKSQKKYLLFEALNEIREELEKENKLIVVRGADRDCASSGMQADMSAGSTISKLDMTNLLNRGEANIVNDNIFHVLDDSKIECVTTIKEQEKYYEQWLNRTLPKLTKNVKKIWKFELRMETLQELSMPLDSRILSIGVIKDIGYLWAEVSGNTNKTQKVKILTIPTGTEFEDGAEFIGTLLYKDGEIVQHIFRLP